MAQKQLKPLVSSTDHVQGTVDAPIEIVEYGDYECPDCAIAYRVVKNIQQVFAGQIRFVYRNFPLTEIHPYAMIAALAAEAAGLQHKYWNMHDLLYENQATLSEALLYQLANQLSLDAKRFERDLQSQPLLDKVMADFNGGLQSQVNGTPTFFVNGQLFDGGAEDLMDMLQESAE